MRFAAAASLAAGLIHAAAAGSHSELRTLSLLFAGTALAQIGWGAAAVLRPRPPVVVLGIGIHLAALGAWLASRTVGVAPVEGLEGGQAVGFQDGLAAALQALAVLGVALALTTAALPRLARIALPVVAAVLAVATVPAMAQPHDHGAHDHGDATGELVAGGHRHGDDDGHEDAGASNEHGDEGHEHDDSDHAPGTPDHGR